MKRIQAGTEGRVRCGAGIIVALTLAALLGGCVIYPVGYYGPPHPYWYDRGYR